MGGASASSIEIIARGLWIRADRVLLCRDLKHGYLYLPGGHVEPGEAASEALAREFEEECGERVRVGRCGLVCENRFQQQGTPRHELNLVFHVEHPGAPGGDCPPIESQEEGLGFEWVEQVRLVEMDVRPDVIRAWLVSGGELGDTTPTGWLSVSEY